MWLTALAASNCCWGLRPAVSCVEQKKGKQALSPPTPKAAAAAATSPPAGAGNANVNNMYEVCRTGPSTHVTATAKALVQSALTNERGAVSKLITLTMRAAGINAVDAAVAPAELDKPNAMDALVDAKAQVARDTELDAESAKDKRTLARGVHSMWQRVRQSSRHRRKRRAAAHCR